MSDKNNNPLTTGKIKPRGDILEWPPVGKYGAMWCGYQIYVKICDGFEYMLDTEYGVRGFVPCVLLVGKNGDFRAYYQD